MDDLDVSKGLEQLQGLMTELSKEALGEAAVSKQADTLMNSLNQFKHPYLHMDIQGQVESVAVSLWNSAVTKKSGGVLSSSLNAKLRHIASSLVFAVSAGLTDESTMRKLIMMATKSGRAWLDAGIPEMAEHQFMKGLEVLEMLKVSFKSAQMGDLDEKQNQTEILELEREHFRLLCNLAETACAQEQFEKGMKTLSTAKEMLNFLQDEKSFLSMMCYNFGVDCFQKQQHEICTQFLKQSYEIGKGAVGAKNQARTLRLLANVYLEWPGGQHWQQATNAAELANAEQQDAVGLYLKLQVLAAGDGVPDSRISTCLNDFIKHPDVTVQLGLSAASLFAKGNRSQHASDVMSQLYQKFKNSSEHDKIAIAQLEFSLQNQHLQQAKQITEEIIAGHNSGSSFDIPNRKRLQIIMWDQAAKMYDKEEYSEALQWYNYSLSLYISSSNDDSNMAKLHRNRASCYIEIDQIEKAEEVITQALVLDPNSCYAQYIKFKIALHKGNDIIASEALQSMCSHKDEGKDSTSNENKQNLICLAAQLAYEKNHQSLTVKSLEELAAHSNDIKQVLTALRCLIKITLSGNKQASNMSDKRKSVVSYIKAANDKLHTAISENWPREEPSDEISWFMKIAWNAALECEEQLQEMYELFTLCAQLCKLGEEDIASLVRQKTCLLMAAAACLQRAKNTMNHTEKNFILDSSLQHISSCRSICQKIEDFHVITESNRPADNTSVLLLLYEFEARSMLGQPNLDYLLEKALTLPNSDTKTFENLAALAMTSSCYRNIASRALKVAIRKQIQPENPDYAQASHSFHKLIQLSLKDGTNTDPSSKQEAWTYFSDLVNLIETKAKGQYPEVEILWLMTKAWNCGIHFYSTGQYRDARKWCELSMKLLNQLGPLKDNYETKMTTMYGEVLEKLENAGPKQSLI